jgi:hypothetical protein
MKRSQIEIVGLLIIVVMISFLLLFVVSTMFKKNDGDDSYLPQTRASRFVGSLLKTDSMCTRNLVMRDLIIDCARSPETGGSRDLQCETSTAIMRPCEYMKNVLDTLLANSFDATEDPYEFRIIGTDQRILYTRNCSIGNGCTQKSTAKGDSWNQPLPVGYQGTMNIRMCIPNCG